MLYNMKDLLKVALENKFGVPAFNVGNFEMLKSVMETAEQENAPVIIEIHPGEAEYLGSEFIAAVKAYAHNSTIPVVIHLDHGRNIEDVMKAIQDGYTSVMIDASMEEFDKNMQISKKISDLARTVNVSVEAELGTIGVNEGSAEGGSDTIVFTNPEEAKYFVKNTGVDTLAIAIGTAHGEYPKNMIPRLNIGLLKQLNQELDIPFVLHGGSGNSDAEISESVKYGVSKINISTDIKSVFFKELQKVLNDNPSLYEPHEIYPLVNAKVSEVVKHKFHIMNTINQASKY